MTGCEERVEIMILRVLAIGLFVSSSASAYEIVHQEWSFTVLRVTVATNKSSIDCRVELNNKPIASATGYSTAGVALVSISVPSAFAGNNNIKTLCFE